MRNSEISRLVARAARGHSEAAAALARRYDAPLRQFVHRRIGNDLRSRVDTDDICQSALLTAFESLSSFRFEGEAPLLGWLNAIAEQKIRNAARRHRAGRRDSRREMPLDPAFELPGAGTSPSQGAVRREVVRDIRSALGDLPEGQRRIVEMHSFEGLAFREIAEKLGMADKSTARRIFLTALKRIGRILDGQ